MYPLAPSPPLAAALRLHASAAITGLAVVNVLRTPGRTIVGAVSLGAIPASPHYPSGSVTLTGTATCPGTATYRFWTKSPSGPWTMVQDYSTTNTFSWSIAGLPLGNYGLEVDVRDQGATDTYEKVNTATFSLS